jgi:hypothetical protein
MQHDRQAEALAVLHKIHHDKADPEGHFAMIEYGSMRSQLAVDGLSSGSPMKELLTKKHNLKRVAIGFLVMFGAQSTGTLVINSKVPSDRPHHTTNTCDYRLWSNPLLEHWL